MGQICSNCGESIWFKPIENEHGVFCNTYCSGFAAYPGFCERCVAETTEETVGKLVLVSGIGTDLYGSSNECPVCHSVVRRLFFCFILPLIPMGKYRVKYRTWNTFHTRRMY